MSWLFLLLSLVGAWLTYNTYHPIYAPPRRAAFSFFAGWLTAELALHHLVVQGLVTLLFIRAGALHAWPGKLGLVVTIVSWAGLWRCYWRGHEATPAAEDALREALGDDYRARILPELSAKFPA